MTNGIRVTDLAAIAAADDILAIGGGSVGRLSSTALATILAGSGSIAAAIAGKASVADLTAAEADIAALQEASVTGVQFTAGGPVACATTANVTLSGEQTIDGVSTSASRVLVKNQTAPEENGIYLSAAGAWSRATDMDAAADVAKTAVFVLGGTANGLTTWATYSAVATLGTDAISWVQVGASVSLTGGQIKSLYEAEADTNAFTDAHKAKLDGLSSGVSDTLDATLDLLCDSLRLGVRGTPVTAAASVDQTYTIPEPIPASGFLKGIPLFATTSGTVTVRRFTKLGGTFTQVGSVIDLTVTSGVNTFTAPADFPWTEVAAGEYFGVYGSGVLAVDTTNADIGGVYIGTGDVTSFTDDAVFLGRTPQIGFDVLIPKTRALEQHIARVAAPNGIAPHWVADPTAIDIDLRRGLVWVPDRREVQPLADWIEFLTSGGYTEAADATLVPVASGVPRIGPRGLRIDVPESNNLFVSPLAPATQDVVFTSGSRTLIVWGEGEVSFPLNNGRTARARQGYPVTISNGDITSPLTLTVTGDLSGTYFGAPVDGSGGVMFHAQQPRPGDLLRMKPQMMSAVNGAAGTVLVETEGVLSNAQRTLGGAGSISLVHRTKLSVAQTTNGTTALSVTGTDMDWRRVARSAVAHDGTGRSIAFGGASASDANARGSLDLIGRSGELNASNRGASMWMRRIQIWPTRKPDADLERLTTAYGGLVLTEVSYPSSVDAGTYPALNARVCYDPTREGADLLIVMHGFSQSSADFAEETLARFAQLGFFVVVPDMRGGFDPATDSDASGREIMDIYDAVQYARDRFAPLVDPDRAHIVGYSGGGGNVLAAAMKLPDIFAGFVDHFGMSDYGFDGTGGWYYTDPSFQSGIETRIGGTPAAVPDAYRSRYAIEGVPANLQGGHLLMFHDTEDASVDVVQSQNMRDAMTAASNSRFTYYETTASTSFPAGTAYSHGLPAAGGNSTSEGLWIPRLARTEPWSLPRSGSLRVHGFVQTRQFSIFLGDGTSGVATVDYDVDAGTYAVTPVTSVPLSVTVTQGGRSASGSVSALTTLTVT